jgi:hypothetical protein
VGPTLRSAWRISRTVLTRWLAIELAAGLIALCVVIVGVGAIVSILLTESLGPLLPVSLGLGIGSVWLARKSWPMVAEAWDGFPGPSRP